MSYILSLVLIISLASVSFSILGSYLVLKNMSMVSDAISHTVILGIVIMFLIVKDLNSPLLIISASFIGVITVFFINMLNKSKYITKEAAIGIVMTFLFSIAIMIVSKYTRHVHLDTDSVLTGEITFAPLDTYLKIPKSIIINIILILINSSVIFLLYKEIKAILFDENYAMSIGISTKIIDYFLIFLVSITTVSNFTVMGSILIVSLMIGPPTIAKMFVKSFSKMIIFSIIISVLSSLIALFLAINLNVSISGMLAVIIGLIYLVVSRFYEK